MKTIFIIAGIIALLLTLVCYACVVVGSRAEREMFGDDREG